jgi:hypothetical protein
MKKQIFAVMGALLIAFSLAIVAQAQWYRGNLKETLKQLEEDSDRFAKSLDNDLDHSRLNGTRREDEINAYVHEFEEATDRLKDRYEDRGTAPGLARAVLERGRAIDRFMRRNRTGGRSEEDWRQVRKSLDKLAWAYNLDWRW